MALWAQRRARSLPAPVRQVAGRALRRLGYARVSPPPSENWSVPLIAGRPSADLEALPVTPTPPRVGTPVEVTERLRCAIATNALDVGGAEEFAAFLARRLPALGLDTHVIYAARTVSGQRDAGGRLAAALAAEGVPTTQVSASTVGEWFAAWRPAVVSAHMAPQWMLSGASSPWVDTLHGMHFFFDPASWRPEQERAAGVAAQIAVSELVRQQYLARVPTFPSARVVTVPNGVDPRRTGTVDRAAARAALGLADEFLFVSLARHCLQKNTYGLVAGFAEVAKEFGEAHLLIAGRADDVLYTEQTKQFASALPCADRVHLRGHCANSAALLAAADCFVLDSFFEGWALSSMEALAAGVPVIASDVGGAREQLAGGARGYLIPNPGGDPERVDWEVIGDLRFETQPNRSALVDAMASVIRTRETWESERARLRAEALAEFDDEVCLRRHAAVLRAVATGQDVPSFV